MKKLLMFTVGLFVIVNILACEGYEKHKKLKEVLITTDSIYCFQNTTLNSCFCSCGPGITWAPLEVCENFRKALNERK